MPPIKRLIVGLGLMLGLLTAVAFALPERISVARAAVIEAPESDVFPYLNDHRRFLEWSPWARRNPGLTYAMSGPDQGEGARMKWDGEGRESGSSEIVSSEPNRLVTLTLDVENLGPARAYFQLAPAGAGTRITWGLDADVGLSPVARWMSLLRARSMGADFELGLARLKQIVEAGM